MSKETLDLSAVFDRDEVRLRNGLVYEIRNPDEFGMLDDFQLNALIKRVDEAKTKAVADDASEEDVAHAAVLLRELATLLLIEFPEDGTLGDWECVAIFDFHMKKRLAHAQAKAAELGIKLPPPTPARKPATKKPLAKRTTRGSSSRGSRRSTEARRKTG